MSRYNAGAFSFHNCKAQNQLHLLQEIQSTMIRPIGICLFLGISVLSCMKNTGFKEPTCEFYCLLSDKYTTDSVYIRTDTLWGKGGYAYVCGRDLDSCKVRMIQWFSNCEDNTIECLRYVFGRVASSPPMLK